MVVKVIGLDISLTATGVAIITDEPIAAEAYVYKTKPDPKPYDQLISNRRQRIAGIVNAVAPLCVGADLVVVEGPSYGSIGGKAHDRAGLWWALVGRISAAGHPVAEVAPTVRALWACGKGHASKGEVTDAIGALWPEVHIRDHNAGDALVLASMGSQWLGLPITPLGHHSIAHRSVHYPEQLTRQMP